jgi:hypothetical protein
VRIAEFGIAHRPAAGVEMAQNHAAQVPASCLSATRSIADRDDRDAGPGLLKFVLLISPEL